MKTEEYKSIEDLLDRFFEGQTSNEEERVLYEFFARIKSPRPINKIPFPAEYVTSPLMHLRRRIKLITVA